MDGIIVTGEVEYIPECKVHGCTNDAVFNNLIKKHNAHCHQHQPVGEYIDYDDDIVYVKKYTIPKPIKKRKSDADRIKEINLRRKYCYVFSENI